MRIGFIGLGNLGLPLAASAVRGGHRTMGFDINGDRLEIFLEHGGIAAGTVSDAAGYGEAVVTVLPDAADVEAVALGRGGILDSMTKNSVYVDMSTIDPHSTRRIGAAFAERGMEMIDAPVARSLEMAWAGNSLLMVGGKPAAIERARPFLDAVSELAIHCGPLGNGAATKLTNNFLANGILAVAVEALGIGLMSGLTLETILETVRLTGTSNRMMLENLPAHAFRGEFEPGFRSALAHKDQRLACGLAESHGLHAPLGAATLEVLSDLVAAHPDHDLSAMLKHREDQAGFSARFAGSEQTGGPMARSTPSYC
ncbi:MAG: NAD(P)-dependent oxidoreductase [Rhodobacteraceae bacterium]|nr:NAD(P)-dependent oxidoreductase [Paracoccaceae bacterium]MCY4140707.1 NAD(P)-dependent oxidoreductase [Paracoccaceae bacterium]